MICYGLHVNLQIWWFYVSQRKQWSEWRRQEFSGALNRLFLPNLCHVFLFHKKYWFYKRNIIFFQIAVPHLLAQNDPYFKGVALCDVIDICTYTTANISLASNNNNYNDCKTYLFNYHHIWKLVASFVGISSDFACQLTILKEQIFRKTALQVPLFFMESYLNIE